jgi:hypothetical protein
VQPFASVATTLYAPAASPVFVAVVRPFDHKYVYGLVPPVGVAVAVPFALPHVDCVLLVVMLNALGCVIVTVLVVTQLFASVIVTLYVLAGKLLNVPLVCAPVPRLYV